jgi:hypothetical protein
MAGSNKQRSGSGRSPGPASVRLKRVGPPGSSAMRKQLIAGNWRPGGTIGGAPNRARTAGTTLTGKRVGVRGLATINAMYRAGYGVEDVRRNPDRARRMGFTRGIAADVRRPANYRYTGLDRLR